MKTTIDIPDKEIEDAIRYTRAKTKKDAVVQAMRDFNKRHRLAEVATMLGTFSDFMTQEDLQQMREDRKWQEKDYFSSTRRVGFSPCRRDGRLRFTRRSIL